MDTPTTTNLLTTTSNTIEFNFFGRTFHLNPDDENDWDKIFLNWYDGFKMKENEQGIDKTER